ncbi:acyl-CoA dehydrogenase family protein [Streptomyces sp. H27-D2]|uniref:acyl-CoA dehydrogenase family protein n=1 Tax=Streptomyces sp. H27-D2 TaxID=3046304 RepID=UPI003FA6D737
MRLRLETARLLMYRLGWLIDHGRPTALDASLAKIWLGECFVRSGLDAVQLQQRIRLHGRRAVRRAAGSARRGAATRRLAASGGP